MSQILLIADDQELSSLTVSYLVEGGYKARVSSASNAAYELCREVPPSVIVVDLCCVSQDFELLERVFGSSRSSAVIVLAEPNDSAKVVRSIRMGAVDYLTNPLDKRHLLTTVRRHLQNTAEDEDPGVVIEELDGDSFFLAASVSMKQIYQQVQRIGRVDVPVLITGESGTGKEIIAKLLHKYSPRAHKRFLKVNCAAVPDELLESELFGYEAGAFTGASRNKPGYFEQCNHGTILLDEIGEMRPRLQAKLLQVLQEGKFFRLGGKWPVEVDVRVLAATNIDTAQAIEEGKLRLDLFYRLNTFGIHLPPLRERKDEIASLFRQFVKRLSGKYQEARKTASESILRTLLASNWPGNLRELQNAAKRYVLFGECGFDIVPGLTPAPKPVSEHRDLIAKSGTLKQVVKEMTRKAEAEAIRGALEQTHGRRQEAADLLGICYKALVYKARRYGILGPSNREKKRLAKRSIAQVADIDLTKALPENVRAGSVAVRQ